MRYPSFRATVLPSILRAPVALALLATGCPGDDSPPPSEEGDGSSTTGPMGSSSEGEPPPDDTTTGADPDTTSGGSTDEGTTGGTTDEGTTSEGSTDEGSTGEEGSSSTGEEEVPPPPWLLSVDRSGGAMHIVQIDIETAATLDFCTLTDANTGAPINDFAYSTTFTRDDRLLMSRANQLWEIALPSCEASQIGPFGFSEVYAIAADEADDLYGLDANTNQLLHIDANTGMATAIGPLGMDWFTLGLTWDDDLMRLVGLDGNTDALYEIDTMTGAASMIQALGVDYFQVAFEWHGNTGLIYACSNNAQLQRIELDGSLTNLGSLGFSDGCFNLAAPFGDMTGLPDLP